MNCTLPRSIAAAALALSLAASAGAQGLSRDEVRAELADARAQGLLDRPGETGASDAVLQARELANETQTRVLMARQELQAQEMPEAVVYLEQGRVGPVVVRVTAEADGSLKVVDAPLAAGQWALWLPIDVD